MSDDSKRQKQVEDLTTELTNAKKIVFDENLEKKKRAAELVLANKELAFQNKEKKKRAAELVIAKKDLALQNIEKEKLAAELVVANKKIVIQANLINARMKVVIEKQLLENTIMSIGDAVIATDLKNNVRLLNKAAASLTGCTQKEALRKPINKVFNIINEGTRENVDDIIAKVIANAQIHRPDNPSKLIRKDGKEILIEDTAALIINEQHQPLGVVFACRDYTQKSERLKQCERLSFHDELTGLYNRRFYEEELKRMDTERNLPLSLIVGDVNGLKLINDSFGHEVGDELIRKAAHGISEVCRNDDIAARIGGDEFVILLPKTNAIDAALVIERIQHYYKMEEIYGLEISISFGTETKVDESQDVNDTYKNAEQRMYRNKMDERSCINRRTIFLITRSLFEKNKREVSHSKYVSTLSETLAKKMALSLDNINQMRLLGLLHDIGKIGISDKILSKDGKLDEDEYDEIKKHVEIGYRLLHAVTEFSRLSDFVLAHHERWDGKGYPRGLKGEEIPIQSRIIALSSSYDAMTSERKYKKALSKGEAVEEIKKCSGTQFDPNLAKVFIEQVL